jgi:ferredoxin
MTEVQADFGRCIGAGMCVVSAPRVFDQDDNDGTVILMNAHPEGEDAAATREAVLVCPAGALSMRD